MTIVNSPAFASLSDAKAYLESILEAEDGVQLQVTLPTSSASCKETILIVTATNNRCPDQTGDHHFMMKVDDQGPTVSINFDIDENEYYFNEQLQGYHIHLVSFYLFVPYTC